MWEEEPALHITSGTDSQNDHRTLRSQNKQSGKKKQFSRSGTLVVNAE